MCPQIQCQPVPLVWRRNAGWPGDWLGLTDEFGNPIVDELGRQILVPAPLGCGVTQNTLSDTGLINEPLTLGPTTGSAVGGRRPYTYAWTRVAGTTGAASPSDRATVTFTATKAIAGTYNSTFRLTVTDAAGTTVTADVDCSWTFDPT